MYNKEYHRKKSLEWYYRNKERCRISSDRNKIVSKKRAKEFILNYLRSKKCTDCPENDPIVLDFDHLKDKKYDICRIVGLGYSVKTIKLELEKCEVVCSNCHRRRTARRGNHYRFNASKALAAKPWPCSPESPVQFVDRGSI